MLSNRGIAGIHADPSCRRQAISPVLTTTRFAENPNMIPKATKICHDITNAPRILAGAFSAENTGTVTSFRPIPIPKRIRQAKICGQDCETAWPRGASKLNMAPRKIAPRLPIHSLTGSDNQQALQKSALLFNLIVASKRAYNNAIAIYGAELMAPMIQEFVLQVPSLSHSAPVSAIPKACGKDRFAPLDPVWSHP